MGNELSAGKERIRQFLACIAKSSGTSSDAVFARQLLAEELADLILREGENFFAESEIVRATLETALGEATPDGHSIFVQELSDIDSIACELVGLIRKVKTEEDAVRYIETYVERTVARRNRCDITLEHSQSEQDPDDEQTSRLW